MPQFDTILYFTFFITFIIYITIIYLLISLFVIPFFWNIYYFRYLKKENNSFFNFIFNVNKNFVLNETKSVASKVNSVFSFTVNSVNYLTHIIMFSYVYKLLKLISKIKNKK